MLFLALLGLTSFASAHTWIEQMNVISSNGSFTGEPGYARGNVLRTAPNFGDPLMTNLIPPNGRPTGNEILSTDPMCMPSQQTQTQTDGSPRLQAAAGSAIALRYQENGHVTLPQNQPGKPANRGTVFVYGTTQPSPNDTLLAIHKVWNADGTGGDKRGVLLSSQNFDDGRCYQENSSPIAAQRSSEFVKIADPLMGINLWCQQDIALPVDAPSGQPYTLYWVWDWPTAVGTVGEPDGKQELYTTCMDVDITSSDGTSSLVDASSFIDYPEQSVNVLAIPAEVSQLSDPTAVAAPTEPSDASNGSPEGVSETAAATLASNVASAGVASTSLLAQTSSAAQIPSTGQASSVAPNPQPTTFATMTSSSQGKSPCPDLTTSTLTSTASSAAAPHFGGSGPGFSTSTVTQYASVTQTIYQTIYPSGFQRNKRTLTTVSSSSSTTSAKFEIRGRVQRGPRLLRD